MIEPFLKNPLEELVRNRVASVEQERIFQVRDLMFNERFFHGRHYAVPKRRGDLVEHLDVRQNMKPEDPAPYDYVINYYRALAIQFAGLLGKAPNAKCMPDERNDVNSRRARKADQILHNLWSQWDSETMMAELALSLWKNGTTFGYTPFVPDSKRFGRTKVPARVEPRPVRISDPEYRCFQCAAVTPESEAITGICQNCGDPLTPEEFFPGETIDIPEVVEYTEFSNGTVEFHLCTPYTVTTPFWLKRLSDSPWLQYEYEEYTGRLLRTFQDLRKADGNAMAESKGSKGILKRYPNPGQDASASTARGQAQSPYSTAWTHSRRDMELFARVWLEPDVYEMFDGIQSKVRDNLYMNYPEGVRLSLINGHLVHMFPESHREVWAACKPSVSEYLYGQPLGNAARELNRLVNNMANIMAQTAERGIPIQMFNSTLINQEALKKDPTQVLDWIPVIPAAGQTLRDAIFTTNVAQLAEPVVQTAATSVDAMKQTTHMTSNLVGQTPPGDRTLGQVEIERNQALVPHSPSWNNMRAFKAECYENGIRQYVKHSPGDLFFARRASKVPQRLAMEEAAEILDGGWHVETEENIPLTAGQRRAQFWRLVELPPETTDRIKLWAASNRPALYDAIGNADLKDPDLDGREKALEVIAELLNGEPIEMPSFDPTVPPQLEPSIPADEFEDDHLLMATVVKEWCQTITGREQKKANPAGYANVIAWGKKHLAMYNMSMAPAPPPAGGGKVDLETTEGGPGAPPPPGAPTLEPVTPPPEEVVGASYEGV